MQQQQVKDFDVHDILRRRKRHGHMQDSLIHGGNSSTHRVFGGFSQPEELDALNKELHVCHSTGKYNFAVDKDALLHGSDTSMNKLHGYFSSEAKLDELDKLRRQTILQGRIKENRADWSDDTYLKPEAPYERKNMLQREELQHTFGECGASIPMSNPEAVPEAKEQMGLEERLFDYYGCRVNGDEIIQKAIGMSRPVEYVYAEARGLTDYGLDPVKARRCCSNERSMEIENEASRNDPSYTWACNPQETIGQVEEPTDSILLLPMGIEGTVPQAVLQQRKNLAQARRLRNTDLRPYDKSQLHYTMDGYLKPSYVKAEENERREQIHLLEQRCKLVPVAEKQALMREVRPLVSQDEKNYLKQSIPGKANCFHSVLPSTRFNR